jgi:hypothetical protein
MEHKKNNEIDLMDFSDDQFEEWLSCGIDERKIYHRKTIDVLKSTNQFDKLPIDIPYISVA